MFRFSYAHDHPELPYCKQLISLSLIFTSVKDTATRALYKESNKVEMKVSLPY